MSRILRRPRAAEDIAEVWDYIADDNIVAADHWVDSLDEQFQLLTEHPLMGRERGDLLPGIRSFPFGRYVIFYLPTQNGIDVVRVLHSAMDIADHLDPNSY
jgi:toxin ParE1/3/4